MEDQNSDAQNLEGMTTNEKLFVLGLFDQWISCIKARDKSQMEAILKKIGYSDELAADAAAKGLTDIEKMDGNWG